MSAGKQKIQIARRQLGLADDAYYAILARVAGVKSSKELAPGQISRVLIELERLGFTPKPAKKTSRAAPKPALGRAAQVAKIEAFLAEASRPWGYADAMAKRMFKVDLVEWCDADQLRRLIAALAYDAKRHGRPAQ